MCQRWGPFNSTTEHRVHSVRLLHTSTWLCNGYYTSYVTCACFLSGDPNKIQKIQKRRTSTKKSTTEIETSKPFTLMKKIVRFSSISINIQTTTQGWGVIISHQPNRHALLPYMCIKFDPPEMESHFMTPCLHPTPNYSSQTSPKPWRCSSQSSSEPLPHGARRPGWMKSWLVFLRETNDKAKPWS